MELVELKSVWQLVNADIKEKDFVDDKILIDTIHQKSETELGKIRIALKIKLIVGSLVGILGLALLLGLFIAPQKFNTLDSIFSEYETMVFYSTLIISLSAMLWFNYQSYKKVAASETQALTLKESLDMVIQAMKKSIRFNIYSDALMSPIVLTWLVYAYVYHDRNFEFDLLGIIILILPILVGYLAYFVQRYTQKLRFGKYVDKLESYLYELQKEKQILNSK